MKIVIHSISKGGNKQRALIAVKDFMAAKQRKRLWKLKLVERTPVQRQILAHRLLGDIGRWWEIPQKERFCR